MSKITCITKSKKLSFLFLFFSMAQIGCNSWYEGPRFGIRQLAIGQYTIYFKKELRGRNYEGLSISMDGDFCNVPSPKTDYFVDSETIGKVFYKVENNELKIYSQSVFTPPQNDKFPVRIFQKENSPTDFNEETALKLGYEELILPVNLMEEHCIK